jgi:hypothetical protein
LVQVLVHASLAQVLAQVLVQALAQVLAQVLVPVLALRLSVPFHRRWSHLTLDCNIPKKRLDNHYS